MIRVDRTAETGHDYDMTSTKSQDWARELDRALTGLAPQQESFLRLSYFEGLRSERIAGIAGVPLDYVSRVIAQGLQHLAELMDCPRAGSAGRPQWRAAVQTATGYQTPNGAAL
jgi:DNA-directed RNA polymerase specialized sigma24 family protein